MNSHSVVGASLPSGTKLHGGVFTIGKVLGQGGCGITYHGADANLRRQVAIKEFFPPGSTRMGEQALFAGDTSSERGQFLEEARALAQFNHPNIVNVLTVFEGNNTAYMVMEYLKGKNLDELVEEAGRLAEKEALAIVAQMSQALTVVHQAGFIHRDIKPGNAIQCDDGRVVLIDFGLNEKLAVTQPYQTRQLTLNSPTGTQGYAPPEQYLKGSVQSIATDIYALGATLYFLLTGNVPVSAPERAMGAPLPAPAEVNPEVSSQVSQAIMQAMALKDKERFQSVQELVENLTGSVASAAPVQVTVVISPSGTVDVSSSSTPPIAPPPPVVQSVVCGQCGAANPQMAMQCSGCNAPLTGNGQPLKITETPMAHQGWIYFSLGIMIIVLYIWAFHT